MVKLYEYQEELVNSDEKVILMNWARGAGKDFGLANYIMKKSFKKVGIIGFNRSLIEEFKHLLNNEEIVSLKDGKNSLEVKLINGDEILIEGRLNFHSMQGRRFDLIVHEEHFSPIPSNVKYDTLIHSISINVNKLNNYFDLGDVQKTITVDHKRMIKANPKIIDQVLSDVNSNFFYDDYAILDNPSNDDNLTFSEFQKKALRRLQKQFLNTSDTKDTVLTRKNIIEMIKDLVELGK